VTAQLSIADGEQLEHINATLAAANLALMQEDDGTFSLWRIERAAAAYGYDRYVRMRGRRYATLVAAMCEVLR
jgi:hypothetical protein